MLRKQGEKGCDGIVVIKKTDPDMYGGTDETLDTRASKMIESDEMTMFSVDSSFSIVCTPFGSQATNLLYVNAFADRAGENSMLYLSRLLRGGRTSSWALVKGHDVFRSLTELVRQNGLARSNGRHSTTHGLPENFGGRADIRYASGERICFSDNQCPIISPETGTRIAEILEKAMEGPRVPLPDISGLRTVSFHEDRGSGGFTEAVLTICDDGTGINRKTSRYDGPKVYESEKKLGKETVDQIKNTIERCGLLAWEKLPPSGYGSEREKTLTFSFGDGTEVTAGNDNRLPCQLSGGFFNIELEITTKG